jgi:hypothetical protein
LITAFLAAIRVFFCSRVDTSLEVLALRQQVAVLKRKRPRPSLNRLDRFFWTTLRHIWRRWSDVLVIVKPETVVGWHRAGFRLYWRWRSRPRGGRPKVSVEIRTLIRRMAAENADWGAPKIHGELLKLGVEVSERTVARYLQRLRRRGDPAKHWLAFLANHREVIVAFDFFTVPTLTFQLLYCFFVIEHGRRRVLHFNITRHPTAEWVVQQLRKAFPEAGPYRYAILDHESKFDTDVIAFKEEPSSRADASLATRLRASICETPIVEYARTGRSCRSFNQFRASRTAGTLAESARPFPAGTDSLWVRLMEVPGKVLHDANVSACCILGKVRTLEFLEHRFA